MYPQNLPTYTHKFLEYKDWIKCETTHYIFNYTSGSEAEKDIEVIKETQENAYKKITSFLKLEKDENKIEYYFYLDPKTKKDLMGDDWLYTMSIECTYSIQLMINLLVRTKILICLPCVTASLCHLSKKV